MDKKKKSLTSTLVKVQKLRARFDDVYVPMLNENVPIQQLCRHTLEMGIAGCFVGVLHRYLFSTTQRMPDRLRQILIEAGVSSMEHTVAWDTRPELAKWAWYRGALNQYHQALLLMVEVYAYPMRKDAARIWKCLDYIFDIPPHLSPKQKAELVITDLRDRMQVFHEMRKVKTTTQMEERIVALKTSGAREAETANISAFADTQRPAGLFVTQQPGFETAVPGMLPTNFSPPPLADSSGSASRQGSVQATQDITMGAMEDIDWVRMSGVVLALHTDTSYRMNGTSISPSSRTLARSIYQTSTSRTSTRPPMHRSLSARTLSRLQRAISPCLQRRTWRMSPFRRVTYRTTFRIAIKACIEYLETTSVTLFATHRAADRDRSDTDSHSQPPRTTTSKAAPIGHLSGLLRLWPLVR